MPGLRAENALKDSLKKLMLQKKFDKITVEDICDAANVSRRDFYRHFCDKYALLSWIYDQNFVELLPVRDELTIWDYYPSICRHLYNERLFYLNAFSFEGQNSFRSRCTELLFPVLMKDFGDAFLNDADARFFIEHITNATFDGFQRWLSDENCMPPDEYAALGKEKVRRLAQGILVISERPPKTIK